MKKKKSTTSVAIQLTGILVAFVVPASCEPCFCSNYKLSICNASNPRCLPPINATCGDGLTKITLPVPAGGNVIAVNISIDPTPGGKAKHFTVWLTTWNYCLQYSCDCGPCSNISVQITYCLPPTSFYIELPPNARCQNVTVFNASFKQLFSLQRCPSSTTTQSDTALTHSQGGQTTSASILPSYDMTHSQGGQTTSASILPSYDKQASDSTPSTSNNGLDIGLPIGLVLLITIIVVLAIFLVCRRRRQLAEWQSVNVSNASREGFPNEYEDVHSSRSTTDQGYQDLVLTSRSTPDQGYQDLVPTSRSTPGQGYQDLVPTSDPLYHTIQAPDKQITNKIRSGNFIPGNPSIPNAPPAAAAASYDDGELTVVDNPFYVSQGQVGANYELAGPMYDNPSFRNNVQPATKLKAADNRNVGDQTLHPGNNDKAGYQGYGLTVIDNSVYGNHEEHSGPTSVPSDATSLQRNTLSGDDDLGQVVIDNTIYKV